MPDVVDYGPTIADLERKRDEIERAIAMLRSLAGLPPVESRPRSDETGPPGEVQFTNRHFFGMTAPDAVLLYLDLVKQARSATKIASDLVAHGFTTTSEDPANTIRTVLRRLDASGEVVQVKKEWGLRDWHPGLRKIKSAENGAAPAETKKSAKKAPKKRRRAVRSAKRPTRPESGADLITDWKTFWTERRKAGKTMKEAGEEWRARQDAEDSAGNDE